MMGAAEPSRIGASPPSISTTALSIESAHKAAMRCSTVAMVTPSELPMVVPKRVCTTASTLASIKLSPISPDRLRKRMPAFAAAGRMTTLTVSPE